MTLYRSAHSKFSSKDFVLQTIILYFPTLFLLLILFLIAVKICEAISLLTKEKTEKKQNKTKQNNAELGSEVYLGCYQTSMMELFAKIVKD